MKNHKLKAAILMFVIYSLFLATGCPPKKDAIRSAVEASYRLPAATNDVITQVATARDRGLISIEQTSAFGVALNKLAKSEVVFVASVKALNDIYIATGQFDPAKLRDLRTFFDDAVVVPFLAVLQLTTILSGPATVAIRLAVTAVRMILRSAGSGFGSKSLNSLAARNGV